MFARAHARHVALVSALAAASCVANTAPPGFLPDVRSAQTDAYGGWVDVTVRTAGGTRRVTGELIAASHDTLLVLAGPGDGAAVPAADVVSGQLVGYDSKPGDVGSATVLGVISTISNGVFLVFTAPAWAIVGGVAAASQSKVATEELPTMAWKDVARFARFPQGLPPGMAWKELRPKR